MIQPSVFDPEKHYLGQLCDRGHEWENTGFSRCSRNNKVCLECDKDRARLYRQEKAAKKKAQAEAELQLDAQQLTDAGLSLDKYKLGKFCPQSHNWQGTGKTLRYANDGKCVECMRASKREDYWENRGSILAYSATYRAANREALLAQKKDYYQRNREQKLARDAEYRRNNPEKIAARQKEWYERNRESQCAYNRERYRLKRGDRLKQKREYSKANRDVIRVRWNKWRSTPHGKASDNRSKAKRKALKLNNHHAVISTQEWLERLIDFDHCCAYCGQQKPLAQDHFIALFQGGSDVIGNLVPACQSCNSSKNAFDPKTWYFQQPFFKLSRWRKILKVLGKTEATYDQIPLI